MHFSACRFEIQDVETLLNNIVFQHMIFDSVFFDIHTLPQAWFCQNLPIDQTMFFFHNSETIDVINHHTGLDIDATFSLNRSQTSTCKQLFKEKLIDLIANNTQYQKSIDVSYWCDHQLINSVQFH